MRRLVIQKLGGICPHCAEDRTPALMLISPHIRTSTWDKYYEDLLSGKYEVSLICRNCEIVHRTLDKEKKKKATKTLFVKAAYKSNIPWLKEKEAVIIDINTGKSYYYPSWKEYDGPLPDMENEYIKEVTYDV